MITSDNIDSKEQIINIGNNNINQNISILDSDLHTKNQNDNYESLKDIPNHMTKEEINNIIERIIFELEEDKDELIKVNKEEITDEKLNIKKPSKKKYLLIEVDEDIDINEVNENNNKEPFISEVKDKIFKTNQLIEKIIKYDGKQFNEDRHKTSDYPKTVNYRCINYRKYEKTRKSPFCNALLKRKEDKNTHYFKLEKDHSKECKELFTNNLKIETNLIGTYKDYITKCFKYLDSTEDYNKKEFKVALENIYNDNKYIFKLKENTIKNIIDKWKSNSLRFAKYNALENRTNKNNELRLWEYNNSSIYISNKKYPINSEYFIWTTDMIIAQARISKHFFIDATFHHPYKFSQLLIIIFKDVISSEYLPGFFILMYNKTEILYTMIFK